MKTPRLFLLAILCAAFAATASAQTVGTIYRIVSANTGKAMTVAGKYKANDPVVMGDKSENDKDQMWALISNGDEESYGLMNLASGMCIDMALSSAEAGKLLQWKPDLSNTNQVFSIKSPGIAGSAMQMLCASNPSLAVTEMTDGTLRMVADITSTNTHFEFEMVVSATENNMPLPYFTYNIHPLAATDCVLSNGGSKENNAPIIVEQIQKDAYGQMWKIEVPAYQGGTTVWYQLFNASCGKCIDCAMESGKAPLQWTQSSAANWNQMFEILPVEDVEDAYQLRISYNGSYFYLAVDPDKNVYTSRDATSADTHFRFTRVADFKLPEGEYWQNEKVFEENKEPAHATYIPYQSTTSMRSDASYGKPWLDPTGSTRWLSLNGTWKLLWQTFSDESPMYGDEVHADDVDASSWDDITVPGCLEMQGYGTPYYINVDYAFSDTPPYIIMRRGMDNSEAIYRRHFTLPEGWEQERVLLHFDGIYSCAYVWVNGQYVGYSEGANMDAEFDVTKYLRTGDNNISLKVIRWTDASYLEGQDMWHMSGIHREVYLMAVPRVFVRDHYLRTQLVDNATSGSLSVDLTLDNRDSLATTKTYEVRLLSPEGKAPATREPGIMYKAETTVDFLSTDAQKQITVEFPHLANLQPWTADSPTLYTVEIAQKDAQGKEESVISTKLGFCKPYIENQRFLVNGKRTLMRGVNTQDTHPITGRTMSTEDMWNDLVLMKQNSVNCVRASHYPRTAKMNAMMDYLGLYMMDEADVEWHKNWSDGGNIQSAPSWRAAIVDRVVRMVVRDRNHPSVISWSLGNESGGGINHQHSYNATRALDHRPIHYEGATRDGTSPTDIYSVMYRPQPEVQSRVDRVGKPYFMCEYAHAMGHAVGNLQEYWDVMENSTNGMGGCIWDWVDQAIVDPNDIKQGELRFNGFNKYRNGNDYPEAPHQGNFCNNGIITADRAATGKLAELKRVYQQVKFSRASSTSTSVRLQNKFESINLEGYTLRWELLLDGHTQQQGTMPLPSIPSGTTKNVDIPYTLGNEQGEYLLNVAVLLPHSTPWAEAGHPLAEAQFQLTERTALADVAAAGAPALTLTRSGNNYTIDGENINMKVNTSKGITLWQQGGMDIIPADDQGTTSPAYSNYRWIENDAPHGNDPAYSASNGDTKRTIAVKETTEGITITERATGRNCNYTFLYTIYPTGEVDLKASYTPVTSGLRRIGMLMQFNPQFAYTRYYARGPLDNTIDRKQGADLGIYSLPVSDFHIDYVRPQTSGDRQDLRWIILHDSDGNGIQVQTEGQVHLSLDNYTDEFKHRYLHQWEMPASDHIYANFDYAQLGVGNASCGHVTPLDKYTLPGSGTYSYRLRFTPVSNVDTGITHLPTTDEHIASSAPAPVYNLRGQLVGNTSCLSILPRGIYVARGSKFVKR